MAALQDTAHELFARNLALTGHCRKSAITAGFAASYGAALAGRPDIEARVSELVQQRFAKENVTAARVVRELARIAFSDPRDLVDDDTGEFLPIHELSDDAAAAVNRIEVEIRSEGHGEDKQVYLLKKVRTHDKMAALSLLARHFKIVGEDSDGVNALANALADRIKAARVRQASANREQAIREAEDAVILPHPTVQGSRIEYGIPDDPSSAGDVTAPTLAFEAPEPDSIALHSGPQRAVALPTVPAPPAAEAKPEPAPSPPPPPAPEPEPLDPYRPRLRPEPRPRPPPQVRSRPGAKPPAASEDDDEDLAG
jgi:phage terminase small subunit